MTRGRMSPIVVLALIAMLALCLNAFGSEKPTYIYQQLSPNVTVPEDPEHVDGYVPYTAPPTEQETTDPLAPTSEEIFRMTYGDRDAMIQNVAPEKPTNNGPENVPDPGKQGGDDVSTAVVIDPGSIPGTWTGTTSTWTRAGSSSSATAPTISRLRGAWARLPSAAPTVWSHRSASTPRHRTT